jgi:hypothetical protein
VPRGDDHAHKRSSIHNNKKEGHVKSQNKTGEGKGGKGGEEEGGTGAIVYVSSAGLGCVCV